MKTQPLRPAYFWWAVLFVLISGFAIRVIDLDGASLWVDEAYTQLWMRAPADRFLPLILEDGVHVPLYFMILRVFPHDGETLLRLPSALEGLVGIALLIGVVRRFYHDDRLALAAGALLAYNPFHIWFSRGARPYALLFVLSLLSSSYFLLVQSQRSRKNWIVFTLSSMAAYMTHYFAAALPLAQYIVFAFFLRHKRRVFRGWIVAQAIAAIPVLIWIVALTQQEVVRMNIKWIQGPVPGDLFLSIWNMTIDYSGGLTWYAALGMGAVLIGLLPGLYTSFRERKKDLVDFYWFWLLVAPLVGTLVFSLLVRPLYVDRYFMVSLPALLILVAYGWTRLPVKHLGSVALVVVVAVGMSNVLTTLHDGTDERQGWREAAQYVEKDYRSTDGFLMSSQLALLSFSLYFDDQNLLDRVILFDLPEAGPDGAPARREWETPVSRLWVLYSNPNESLHNEGVLKNFDPFEATDFKPSQWLIDRRDQIVSRRDFRGVTVFLVDVTNDVYNTDRFGK